MRIFFIVAAAVLFVNRVERGIRETDRYRMKHPDSNRNLIPTFWVAAVVVGFLWAVLWH